MCVWVLGFKTHRFVATSLWPHPRSVRPSVRPGTCEQRLDSIGGRFLSQPFFVAEIFTDMPGTFVDLATTISDFDKILSGKETTFPKMFSLWRKAWQTSRRKLLAWPRQLRNETWKWEQRLTSQMLCCRSATSLVSVSMVFVLAAACKSCPFKTEFAASLHEILSASRQIATRRLGSKRSTRSTHRTISPREFVIDTGSVLFASFSGQSQMCLSMRTKFCNIVFRTEASDIRNCRGRSNRDLGNPSWCCWFCQSDASSCSLTSIAQSVVSACSCEVFLWSLVFWCFLACFSTLALSLCRSNHNIPCAIKFLRDVTTIRIEETRNRTSTSPGAFRSPHEIRRAIQEARWKWCESWQVLLNFCVNWDCGVYLSCEFGWPRWARSLCASCADWSDVAQFYTSWDNLTWDQPGGWLPAERCGAASSCRGSAVDVTSQVCLSFTLGMQGTLR